MSSPIQLVLADLDNNVQALEYQFDCLAAGLAVDEHRVIQALQSASQLAMMLSKLIGAERPGAQWNDRGELEKLIQELQAAAEAKRNQQRSDRLLELANELDAGRVKHRFQARTSALNEWRAMAVDELRAQAALPQPTKELPGPDACHWLAWAFNLQDERDAQVLAYLGAEFPVLEHFTGEMEDSYWVPGRPLQQSFPERSVSGESDKHASAKPITSASSEQHTQSDSVGRRESDAPPTGDYAEVLARSYDRPAIPMSAPGTLQQAGTANQPQPPDAKLRDMPSSVEAKPSASLSSGTAVEQTTEPPPTAAESSAEIPSSSSAGITGEPSAELSDDGVSPKRVVLAWTGAAGFIVLSALFFAIIYHMHARSSSKPGPPTAEAATTNAPANLSTPETPVESAGAAVPEKPNTPEAAANPPKGPLLHKQPAEGAQDSILLSLENCDRGNPGGIECWGYVSNLGGASSRVSLDRVDVVDGRGNSFSLDRKDQFAFATGQSSTVPAGSRVKFTLKVPDKDLEARTLTLYMDLSNPRSLEYTFRNVPVAE